MDRTNERRRRPPQGQPQRRSGDPGRRQPGGYDRPPQRRSQPSYREEYPPQRRSQPVYREEYPPQRRSQPAYREEYPPQRRSQEYPPQRRSQPRREDYPARSRSSQPQRSRPPQYRQYEEPRRRSYDQQPRARQQEAPARRRPPQDYQQRRTYNEPPRRQAPPPSRRYDANRRERREQERRRRQKQNQRNLVTVLLVVIASMMAVFCLYDPEDGKVRLPRPNIEAHTDEPPTEPPTEAPTKPPKPPIVVTPISTLEDLGTLQVPNYVSVQIIDVDYASRRGIKLTGINDIVLHYVGNPGTSAQDNRDWYAESNSEVSSHFVVGLQGEVIQCIPLDEKSSASNHRNGDTISIEICHPDASGKFNEATYDSVVELTAWLVKACNLDIENVIRHYEVTGKICPKYYVENDDAWVQLRADIAARLGQ